MALHWSSESFLSLATILISGDDVCVILANMHIKSFPNRVMSFKDFSVLNSGSQFAQ